jgi:hypothetical protein
VPRSILLPALALSLLAGAGVSTASAQLGTTSISPVWRETPRAYPDIPALFADSVGISWDGEDTVTVELRVLFLEPEVAFGVEFQTLRLAPGSTVIPFAELLEKDGFTAQPVPVLRWAQAPRSVPGTLFGPDTDVWSEQHLAAVIGDLAVDWAQEMVSIFGLTAGPGSDLTSVDVVALVVVVPR